MAEKKISEFRNIRLEPADNGFVLEYSEVSQMPGTMCDRDYNDRHYNHCPDSNISFIGFVVIPIRN